MTTGKEIDVQKLGDWLAERKKMTLLDIRPITERDEWYIPNSIHINAYDGLKAGNPDSLDGLQIDRDVPVVTFCAGGRTSRLAAEILAKKGFDAYSLTGGMKAWNYAYDTAVLEFDNFKIVQVRRVAKGCLSYIVGSGNTAMVFDASLDPNIYESIAGLEGWKINLVTDTHIHADYVSRSRDLAKATAAMFLMNSKSAVEYPFVSMEHNEILKMGEIGIKAIHTPGHTWESTAFLIDNKVLLTGDTLFTDGIGRPDLKADQEGTKRKSEALFNSLQFINSLGDDILILPAHISRPVTIGQPIIAENLGKLKKTLPVLASTIDDFVAYILLRLPPSPPNYLTIAEINKTGNIADFSIADLEAGANRCAIK